MKTHETIGATEARYDMSPDEVKGLETELVEDLKAQLPTHDSVYTVWLPPSHKYANIVRSHEAAVFPEIVEFVSDEVEANSDFLAIVDLRDEDRVVHAFRVSGMGEKTDPESPDAERSSTGFILIDEIVETGQIDREGFQAYYNGKGVDLNKCFAVETNLRIGERVADHNGLSIAEVGYVALFKQIQEKGLEQDASGVFANLNIQATKSLGKVGVTFDQLMDRDDIRTPGTGESGFDDHYKPVFIPASEGNLQIFGDMVIFAAEELHVA